MSEEPLSPRPSVKSPAPDSGRKDKDKVTDTNGAVSSSASAASSGPSSSTERSEELKTPDSIEEILQIDDVTKPERADSKSSPQSGRRYGVQVMGSGLLAEMKAKQEKRAANKVGALRHVHF